MRILITGSEGSLMQSLIPKLLQKGHEIIGADNLYRYGEASKMANKLYHFQKIDLTDREMTKNLFKNIDCVILAAAKIYGVGGFNHFCADILSDDIAIQGNVFQSCVENKVGKVIYISSSMVYETCIQDINTPVTETMIENCQAPKTEYGLSKFIGERMCKAFKKQYGINYTIWRPFNIITPSEEGMSEQGFSHVFADFLKNIIVKKKNPLPIIGDGNQIRCFTWIEDVAEIIANYSFDELSLSQAYNICNVEPITMKTLANKIHNFTNPKSELTFETKMNFKNDVLVRVPSVDKFVKSFGNFNYQNIDKSIEVCINQLKGKI